MTAVERALRKLQQAVRAYALGLGNEEEGWKRILEAELEARGLITRIDLGRLPSDTTADPLRDGPNVP